MIAKTIIVSSIDAATLWAKQPESGCTITESKPIGEFCFKVSVEGPEDKIVDYFNLIGERVYAYGKKN